MKVLFSTDQIYLHGGLEKVIAQKANYLADVLNYAVVILTTQQKNNPPCYQLSSKIILIDIDVNYDRKKSYFSIFNIKKSKQHFKKSTAVLKKIKPNVVIVCNHAYDFYWVPFFNKDFKTFKEYHSSRFFLNLSRKKINLRNLVYNFINDYFESKYSKIILLNNDELDFYKSKNTVVIANPIEKSSFLALLKNKKAIAAGRIAPVKGFENLLKTWQLVTQKEPSWQLDIYGDGDAVYINSLQELIKKLKLEAHVFIKPATNDLLLTMTNYSMYLMTSITECLPMVLLESLSVGLPVIAFDCPTGPRNIVENNLNGFLVKDQNCIEMVEKICLLINNEETRIIFGQNAKKSVEKFNLETIMNKWIILFED